MEKISNDDQDFNLWVLLTRAREAMGKARKKELFPYGVSHREAAVLYVVQSIGGKATPAEIARWQAREPHLVSALLSKMVNKGLVRKVKDLSKKNRVRVELTDKGLEVYYKSLKRESVHKIMSVLSEEERRQLTSCLEKIRNKALEQLEKKTMV